MLLVFLCSIATHLLEILHKHEVTYGEFPVVEKVEFVGVEL